MASANFFILNGFLVMLLMQTASAAGADVYVYPERVELTPCTIAPEELAAIETKWSRPADGPEGMAHAIPVDLNRDGKCELFVKPPLIEQGNFSAETHILMERDGTYVDTGVIDAFPVESWWYGDYRNGYARLFVPTNAGETKVNALLVTQVYTFDGQQFVAESGTTLSHGAYLDSGTNAYRSGNYLLAEKYYLDAYRMHKDPAIADASNLALTWLKLGKSTDAKALLEKHLEAGGPTAQLAAAHFNLGLVEQQLGHLEAALSHYEEANKIEPSPARREKIEAVRKLR